VYINVAFSDLGDHAYYLLDFGDLEQK